MYSEYCNNHHNSIITLVKLTSESPNAKQVRILSVDYYRAVSAAHWGSSEQTWCLQLWKAMVRFKHVFNFVLPYPFTVSTVFRRLSASKENDANLARRYALRVARLRFAMFLRGILSLTRANQLCRFLLFSFRFPLGFLLTPVQRICKYPLQLGELLKHTPLSHAGMLSSCF